MTDEQLAAARAEVEAQGFEWQLPESVLRRVAVHFQAGEAPPRGTEDLPA